MPVDTVAANKIIVQCHNLNLNLVTGSDLKIKYLSKNIMQSKVLILIKEKKKNICFLKNYPFVLFREGEFHPVFFLFYLRSLDATDMMLTVVLIFQSSRNPAAFSLSSLISINKGFLTIHPF